MLYMLLLLLFFNNYNIKPKLFNTYMRHGICKYTFDVMLHLAFEFWPIFQLLYVCVSIGYNNKEVGDSNLIHSI